MANGYNTGSAVLPSLFGAPGDALQQAIQNRDRQKERDFEINYRLQKDKEADDWKKLGLIRELTDLDKYQTGEAAADAVGHQKMQELVSKYTSLAGKMSPAELQYNITQDTGKTISGMQGMKDELVQSEASIKKLKQQFPNLDSEELTKLVRAETVHRRIEGNDFANPLKANAPSSINLSDPDFLSNFIDVNKSLREAAVNPKNIQKGVSVLRGSPSSYTEYVGNLPFFMKDEFKTKEGFYNEKPEPQMSMKTETIPQGAFSGVDKPINVLDKNAYEGLISENSESEMALRKLAKSKYSNYASMSDEEKEIARRDVATDFLKPYSENYKYRPKTATKPSHYSSTTNVYGTGGEANINKVYEEIKSESSKHHEGKTPLTILSTEAQKAIIEQARSVNDSKLTQADIWVQDNKDGTLDIFKLTDPENRRGEKIGVLTPKGVNITKQVDVKAKKAVVEKANKEQKPAATKIEDLRKKYNY